MSRLRTEGRARIQQTKDCLTTAHTGASTQKDLDKRACDMLGEWQLLVCVMRLREERKGQDGGGDVTGSGTDSE